MRPVRLLLLPLACFLLAPAAARARCGGVVSAKPKHRRGTQAPPLFLGDSTGVFATPRLARRGVEANARECRQVSEGLSIMRARKRAGTLPRVVIFALGANWRVTSGDIAGALRIVGGHRILVLVTHRATGGGAGPDRGLEIAMARKHRERIRLLDWVAYARGHGGWFASDGLHVTYPGADHYAAFVARAKRFNAPWGTPAPR